MRWILYAGLFWSSFNTYYRHPTIYRCLQYQGRINDFTEVSDARICIQFERNKSTLCAQRSWILFRAVSFGKFSSGKFHLWYKAVWFRDGIYCKQWPLVIFLQCNCNAILTLIFETWFITSHNTLCFVYLMHKTRYF